VGDFSWARLRRSITNRLRGNGIRDCLKPVRTHRWMRKGELISKLSKISRPFRFSIIINWYPGKDISSIKSTIRSINYQIYSDWELCLITTINPSECTFLETENIPVSFYTNLDDSLRAAKGHFVIPVGPGDQLVPEALAELVLFLDRFPDLDLVYSDEDYIDDCGKHSRCVCKPDWSPDLLLSHNYIGRLAAYRKEKLLLAGGFSSEGDISDDYALALRFTELAQSVGHIPQILYSRFIHAPLVSSELTQVILDNEMRRRGWQTHAKAVKTNAGVFRVHWSMIGTPLISIIICTHDRADLLEVCLRSIFEKSTYSKFEVILVDNGSKEPETKELIHFWSEREPVRFRSIRMNVQFNFSLLNNQAATQARGELLLFLNNDTQVVSPQWLEEMAAQAQRTQIGAVSALLVFPDQRVQHAGILVGGKELAFHAFRGLSTNLSTLPIRLIVPSNFPALTGACLMMRKELFLSFGGFNEDLAISYGDVDLCLRLKKAGYFNILLPYIKLIHHESATRGYETTLKKRRRLRYEARLLKKLWPDLERLDRTLTA